MSDRYTSTYADSRPSNSERVDYRSRSSFAHGYSGNEAPSSPRYPNVHTPYPAVVNDYDNDHNTDDPAGMSPFIPSPQYMNSSPSPPPGVYRAGTPYPGGHTSHHPTQNWDPQSHPHGHGHGHGHGYFEAEEPPNRRRARSSSREHGREHYSSHGNGALDPGPSTWQRPLKRSISFSSNRGHHTNDAAWPHYSRAPPPPHHAPFRPPTSSSFHQPHRTPLHSPVSPLFPNPPLVSDHRGPNMHPLLHGNNPRKGLVFDLSDPNYRPSLRRNVLYPVDDETLAEYATLPPCQSLIFSVNLASNAKLLFNLNSHYARWGVVPLPGMEALLTVEDVLRGVYRMFRERVSHEVYAAVVGRSPQVKYVVDHAYRERCRKMGPRLEALELANGVKKVDLLGDMTKFVGFVLERNVYGGTGSLRLVLEHPGWFDN